MNPKLLTLVAMAVLSGCASQSTLQIGSPFYESRLTTSGYDIGTYDKLPDFIEVKLNYPPKPLYNSNPLREGGELGVIKQILGQHFQYATDMSLYGKQDAWMPPIHMARNGDVLYGDCEDYALLARAMLKKRGFDSKLTLVKVEGSRENHVILEVGEYVLDNRTSVVSKHGRMRYQYLTQSGYSLDEPWRAVTLVANTADRTSVPTAMAEATSLPKTTTPKSMERQQNVKLYGAD